MTAPHLHSRFEKDAVAEREIVMPAERGLTWSPTKRQNQKDFGSFQQETVVVINEFEGNSLTDEQMQSEQELVVLIQQSFFKSQSETVIVDNIRKNHYKSKNSNVVCCPRPESLITSNSCRTLSS